MIEKGLIERVARGVYIGEDTFEDQYFITQAICRKGIFSHETALYFHDLCDRTPIRYQLTIPSYYNTKLLKDKSYDFFYLNLLTKVNSFYETFKIIFVKNLTMTNKQC